MGDGAVLWGTLWLAIGMASAALSDEAYRVHRTDATATALLEGDREAWNEAARVSWGPVAYATHFRALWNEQGLYVRFDAVDTSPWHTLTERDDELWKEEVVEIFIDPDRDGRNYAEIEINPANVVCDLVIFEGAPNLRSDIHWDFEGMQTRVLPWREDGKTVGWMAMAFLPWEGFGKLPDTGGVTLPPHAGDAWRFNLFRIKRPGGPEAPEKDVVYAAWSPVTGKSFHEPAVFRDLTFAPE